MANVASGVVEVGWETEIPREDCTLRAQERTAVLLSASVIVETEILAARLTRIKTLIDALERACLESEAARDTFLKLKLELEAARISVRPVRPIRP